MNAHFTTISRLFWLKNLCLDHTCTFIKLLFKGDDWKDIRTTFCPIFTSAKIKQMAPLVTEVSVRLVDSLEHYATKREELDLRVLFAKYTMDSLASCAFGVNAQSFSGTDNSKPHSPFTCTRQLLTCRGSLNFVINSMLQNPR